MVPTSVGLLPADAAASTPAAGRMGAPLGLVHASLHEVHGPDEIPALRGRLRLQLQSQLVPDDIRQRALRILESLPDGDRLCHCDFHPANVLRDGRWYAVIDWSCAARGDSAADVARTRLLLKESALPDEASPMMRAMAQFGRRGVVSGYLRSYHRATGVSLSRWRAGHQFWQPRD